MEADSAELGRLGLLAGLLVHTLAGAAWVEGAHRALAWRESVPAGWQQSRDLALAPWASPGPLGPGDAPWTLRGGGSWAPRQPGLTQQPGSIRARLAIPEGGRAELWAARPAPQSPGLGGVGLVLERGLAPRTTVVRTTGHGWERLPCADELDPPTDAPMDVGIAPEGRGVRVEVDEQQVFCGERPHGSAPALRAGARVIGVHKLAVDGRPSPRPGQTPRGVRWLLGGAFAAGLFLAEGMLGVAALASMVSVLPLLLTPLLGDLLPEQLGLVLGLSGGSTSLAWGIPLGISVWIRVCAHAHHRLRLPPGHRDWPAAAPLAMALLGSLGWGAREGTAGELAPIGLGLALALLAAVLLPKLLQRHGEPQPLRTTTWILAPVGAVVLVAGISGAGAAALLGGVAVGLGAGLGAAVLAGRLRRSVLGLVLLLGLGGAELFVRGLEADTPARQQVATGPVTTEDAGPRRPLVVGSLGGPGGRPGGPAAAVVGLRPTLARVAAAALRSDIPGLVVGLRTEDFLVQREDLHELRILGSASLARMALLRDLLAGRPPASVSVSQARGALEDASRALGPRPLLVVVSASQLDAGAAWPWIRALADLAENDPTVTFLVHRGDTAALEHQLESMGR